MSALVGYDDAAAKIEEDDEVNLNLAALPIDVLLQILEWLAFRDVLNVSLANRRLNAVAQNDELWTHQMAAFSLPRSYATSRSSESQRTRFLRAQRRCRRCHELFSIASSAALSCRIHAGVLTSDRCRCGFFCSGFDSRVFTCCGFSKSCMPLGCKAAPHDASHSNCPAIIEIGFRVPSN